ncbi:hypothetical protein AWC38_SpisGene24338 [Stylophora pistillata]|uniref:Uncharacterized protein n=1 Tax=Stylophora pistillata TaxID=50429 RepID=A0A2B4R2F5_STYPI|nr:hypothetical protein AWC38_SpisGene24338 [Stylophora pistillata]
MQKHVKSANHSEHQNRKTEPFWPKNRNTDPKNSQNRKTENPKAPLLKDLNFKKIKTQRITKILLREERSKTYDDFDWTLMYRVGQLRKFKVSSPDLTWTNMVSAVQGAHSIEQDKVDIVATHIARSIVNNDAMNNEEDDFEAEESDEEYRDDVVLEEIGGESDEDETTETAQQNENDEDDNEGDDDNEDNDNRDYDADDDRDEDDDNDDSSGGVSDDVNEGNNDDNSEEVQISDIVCTTKSELQKLKGSKVVVSSIKTTIRFKGKIMDWPYQIKCGVWGTERQVEFDRAQTGIIKKIRTAHYDRCQGRSARHKRETESLLSFTKTKKRSLVEENEKGSSNKKSKPPEDSNVDNSDRETE